MSIQRHFPATHRGAVWTGAILLSFAVSGCVQYATAPPITPWLSPTATISPSTNAVLPSADGQLTDDWLLVSIEEQGFAHLFRFELASAKLTRLTSGEWHDINPSLSSDGALVAFASDRGGFWDLYSMDLRTGGVSQLTNTPEYDGTPVWSPDMAWLAHETYIDGQLDIVIRSMTEPAAEPVALTNDPASDHSPAWSPDGRKIAFVSSRTGDGDIWLADLDNTSERFSNLSHTPGAIEGHPAWSRDGTRLAWAASSSGVNPAGIYIWDQAQPEAGARRAGFGSWPAWDADGSRLATASDSPTEQLLSAYTIDGMPLMLPFPVRGRVHGLVWPTMPLPEPLPAALLQAAQAPAPLASTPPVSNLPDVPSQRWHIVSLEDVQATGAGLHALVEPTFGELRKRVIVEAGWDALASLESAFVPLTKALDPGMEQDWLYTGRAFAINTLMLNAGWMSVSREDIDNRTFWRVYIRARNQDGSQGRPLTDPPWDLNARFELDPHAYEDGGSYGPVPAGYWVDLTALAEMYGWHRLPALPSWRTYYSGARFTEFAATGGLDWYSAMLELYPADALITPTVMLPPTITPSRTPRPTTTPYPTWTPRPTRTATITTTPLPSTATPPTIIPTFPTPTP